MEKIPDDRDVLGNNMITDEILEQRNSCVKSVDNEILMFRDDSIIADKNIHEENADRNQHGSFGASVTSGDHVRIEPSSSIEDNVNNDQRNGLMQQNMWSNNKTEYISVNRGENGGERDCNGSNGSSGARLSNIDTLPSSPSVDDNSNLASTYLTIHSLRVTTISQVMAVLLLLSSSLFFFYWFHFTSIRMWFITESMPLLDLDFVTTTELAAYNNDYLLRRIQRLAQATMRLTGFLLIGEVIGCTILLWDILCDFMSVIKNHNGKIVRIRKLALHHCRMCSVTVSVTGLILVVVRLLEFSNKLDDEKVTKALVLSQHTTKTATNDASIITLCQFLFVTGTGMLLLSCISLMASFWPVVWDDTVVDAEPTSTVTSTDELHEPLLGPEGNVSTTLESNQNAPEGTEQSTMETESFESTTPQKRIRGTRRLLQLATHEVRYLYTGCLVLLIRLPFSLAIPHFVSTTLSALTHLEYQTAYHSITCILILGTIDSVLDFWCVFLFGYTNQRIVRSLRSNLFRTLMHQEVAYFDANGSGELTSRLNADCSQMASDLTWFFRFSIESIVRITGIATYLCIRCPILGLYVLMIIPVVAMINKVYADLLKKNAIEVQDALAVGNAVAQETLLNVRTVLACATEDYELKRYQSKIDKQYHLNIRQLFMTGIYYMVVSTFLINTIVQGTLLYIGGNLIRRGLLTSDVLLAFMLYQGQLQNETMNLFNSFSSLIKSSGAGDKVFALMDRKPPPPAVGAVNDTCRTRVDSRNCSNTSLCETNDNQNVPVTSASFISGRETNCSTTQIGNTEFDADIAYHIKLQNITFAYPSRNTSLVLDNVSLEFLPGQTTAIVGASGCGKTTIMNLLQRFYDPKSGTILVNDINLKDVDLQQYRRHVGVVSQDPVLFQGTITDNITYGSKKLAASSTRPVVEDDDRVVKAATLAHAAHFISTFPCGYQTHVGERGVQLSGGQKQRITIARAVYQRRSLLIFDEATSALDNESENAVQEALDDLFRRNNGRAARFNTTVVVIAHRLSTVQNADKIIVLHEGRVAEQGTHAELMKYGCSLLNDPVEKHGLYRAMVEQASTTGKLEGI